MPGSCSHLPVIMFPSSCWRTSAFIFMAILLTLQCNHNPIRFLNGKVSHMIEYDPDVPIRPWFRNSTFSITVGEVDHQCIPVVAIMVDILDCRGKCSASSTSNFFLYIGRLCDAIYALHLRIALQNAFAVRAGQLLQ